MEPRIEYATTTDGVSIAYSVSGEGVPLVNVPPAMPWSDIQQEWDIPEWRHYYEHIGENFRLIRYDNRGSGLSTRDVKEFSIDGAMLDLEAVVARLGLESFVLFGFYFNAQLAVRYALKHPEHVSHLVLWHPILHMDDDNRPAPLQAALDQLMELDYGLFTETLAHTVFGWEQGAAAHRMALYMQSSMSADLARNCWRSMEETTDVRKLLGQISMPTAVIHRRDFKLLDIEVSKRVAATIPQARLIVLPGASLSPYLGDYQGVLDALNSLVGIADTHGADDSHRHRHGDADSAVAFRTIIFTDMQESTAFTQRLGDARAQDLIRLHNAIVERAVSRHGGTRVKHTGDGIMASFPTATGAVECALDIQREIQTYNAGNPATPVGVRIGINAGEPVAEGDDLFGTSVQLASRVCARARPGEILTTDVVRQLVAGKGFLFSDRGEAALRGFEDPVRIFDVHWQRDP